MNRKLLNKELGRISAEEFKNLSKIPLIIVLDNVRSAYNVGAVFRTADAFRIEEVILCGITATPPHREVHKTALGASENVKWSYCKNTVEAISSLKEKGYINIAIEQTETGISLQKFFPDREKRYAVVFGNEVIGVSQEVIDLSDICVEIPQYGTKHSLNLAVSVGIVVWDMLRKIV